jgi:hypothetical protein
MVCVRAPVLAIQLAGERCRPGLALPNPPKRGNQPAPPAGAGRGAEATAIEVRDLPHLQALSILKQRRPLALFDRHTPPAAMELG